MERKDVLDKMAFIVGVDVFLEELRINEKSQSTLKKYRRDLNKFVQYADGEITKDTIIDYKKNLIDAGYRPASINSYLVVLNKYLKWLGYEPMIVKLLKIQRRGSLEEVIDVEDYKRLLRYAKKRDQMDMYWVMKVLACTGIRIEELRFITVESIQSNYIRVCNKGKNRTVILRQDLARELRRYCKHQGIRHGYVFAGKKEGKMISKSTIWRRLKKIAGAARVNKKKVHAHSFRHFFAKQFLMQNNNNILELADILGHESLDTTRIYNVSTDAEKRKKLENMKFK